MSHQHQIADTTKMREFVLGGRAYFTLLNTATGGRVTYCVDKGDADGTFVVRAFTGSDNADRRAYSYLGNVEAGSYRYAGEQAAIDALLVVAEEKVDPKTKVVGDQWLVGFCKNIRDILARGGTLSERQKAALDRNIKANKVASAALSQDDIKAKGFAWFWRFLSSGRDFPETFQFWHEGRCARCGRRLTVPESIATGWGPECAAVIGVPMVQVSTPPA